jgi:hypothetical protein
MRRRDFVCLATAWPLVARAQANKIWRIGCITHVPVPVHEALFEPLRELGYVEGQNTVIERRYAQGEAEKFNEFAADMVRLKADVIIVFTTPAALAAKNATATIPIVFPTAIDPVGTGLVASLAHPGGNVTGVAARYARGKLGVVERCQGCHVYPDSVAVDQGDNPQWLYTVVFTGNELWGPDADPTVQISIEAFEPYLESA